MIPKTIHYCWFGRNSKPRLAEKCINSWKKYCPDYEIIEWNEDNFDLASCPIYVRQAYEAKKWAFVTDYARLKIIYENGGVYFDTDVEIIKPINDFLKYSAFFGFEDATNVATGLGFGAKKGASILQELMDDYIDIPFILSDGSFDTLACPKRNINVFIKHGLTQNNTLQILCGDILILPSSYLCPIDYSSGRKYLSNNTVSIHWFAGSWQTKKQKYKLHQNIRRQHLANVWHFITHIPNRIIRFILGNEKYAHLKRKFNK